LAGCAGSWTFELITLIWRTEPRYWRCSLLM